MEITLLQLLPTIFCFRDFGRVVCPFFESLLMTPERQKELEQQAVQAVNLLVYTHIRQAIDQITAGNLQEKIFLVGEVGRELILNGVIMLSNSLEINDRKLCVKPFYAAILETQKSLNEYRASVGLPLRVFDNTLPPDELPSSFPKE